MAPSITISHLLKLAGWLDNRVEAERIGNLALEKLKSVITDFALIQKVKTTESQIDDSPGVFVCEFEAVRFNGEVKKGRVALQFVQDIVLDSKTPLEPFPFWANASQETISIVLELNAECMNGKTWASTLAGLEKLKHVPGWEKRVDTLYQKISSIIDSYKTTFILMFSHELGHQQQNLRYSLNADQDPLYHDADSGDYRKYYNQHIEIEARLSAFFTLCYQMLMDGTLLSNTNKNGHWPSKAFDNAIKAFIESSDSDFVDAISPKNMKLFQKNFGVFINKYRDEIEKRYGVGSKEEEQ